VGNLDDALERFHLGDLEYAGGLANHGPMAVEALERLGHQALIPAFLGLYAPRVPLAGAGRPLAAEEEAGALGDVSRSADWVATYEARLAEGDWRSVVRESLPKLTIGLFAGAGHGFLRTAHALRSLESTDDPLRRRELAHGLAYWSARFQPLPGGLGLGKTRAKEAAASLSDWPLVGEAESRTGFFFESVRRLDSFPDFAAAIEGLALPGPGEVDEFISALCRAAAVLYLDHPQSRIPYVHVLTIPSAARLVVGHLAESDACLLAGAVFQASAAMHSIFGEDSARSDPDPDPDAEVERVSERWDEICYHAACSLQEHAIKMTEACWREDQIREDPIFRAAAADAALKIDARRRAAEC
jgi:hypothetical protein